jgi:hypothetical protein
LHASFEGGDNAGKEELALRLQGRLPFNAQPLRERGWMGKWIYWSRYENKSPSQHEKPHAVLIGSCVPPGDAEWLEKQCKRSQVLTYRVPSEVEWLMESLNRDLKHVLLQKALQSYTISAEDAYCTGKTAAHVVHDRQMHGVLVKAEDEAYFTASTEALRHQAKTGGPSLRLPKREQAVQEPRRMKQHKTDWIRRLYPPHLRCPITKDNFINPYITKYGYTYEMESIKSYAARTGKDYITQRPLNPEEMYPNRIAKAFLDAIQKRVGESQAPHGYRISYQGITRGGDPLPSELDEEE